MVIIYLVLVQSLYCEKFQNYKIGKNFKYTSLRALYTNTNNLSETHNVVKRQLHTNDLMVPAVDDVYQKRKQDVDDTVNKFNRSQDGNPIIDKYGGNENIPNSNFESLPNTLSKVAGKPNINTHHLKPSAAAVWGYAFLFVTIICLCSIVGAIFISFMKKKYYKLLLQFMIGLAMGSLSGSAVFHLIPQTFDLVDNDEHHLYINKSATIIAGIYLFLITEWLIKITLQQRKKHKSKREAKQDLLKNSIANGNVPAIQDIQSDSRQPFVNQSMMGVANSTKKRAFKRVLDTLTCQKCFSSSKLYSESLSTSNNIDNQLSLTYTQNGYLNTSPDESFIPCNNYDRAYKDPFTSKTCEASEFKESLILPSIKNPVTKEKLYTSNLDILEENLGLPTFDSGPFTIDNRPRSKSCSTKDTASQDVLRQELLLKVNADNARAEVKRNPGSQIFKFSGPLSNTHTTTCYNNSNNSHHKPYNPSTSIYFNQYPGITPSPGFPNFENFLENDDEDDTEAKVTLQPPPPPLKTSQNESLNAIKPFRKASKSRSTNGSPNEEELIRTCSHEDIHLEGQTTIATLAYMILLGDGLHNFIDGLSIGAAFSQNILTGISISLAVIFEEFPHELGDFAILLNSGMPVKKAMLCNFLSATTCYLGMIFGILLGENRETSFYIFALAAGMFLYISLVDMMPELNKIIEKANQTGNLPLTLVIQYSGIALGLISMSLLAKYGTIIVVT